MTARRGRPRSGPAMSDGRLASRAAQGDSLAFAVLLDRHADLVRAASARYFLPGHKRSDVEQEASLGLYRACVDFRPERGVPFRAFADLCVCRAVVTALTVARRAKHGPLNERIALETPLTPDRDGPPVARSWRRLLSSSRRPASRCGRGCAACASCPPGSASASGWCPRAFSPAHRSPTPEPAWARPHQAGRRRAHSRAPQGPRPPRPRGRRVARRVRAAALHGNGAHGAVRPAGTLR
jgi:DNA-directed RNA polymerase specialized sigma24 family protein